MLYIIGFGGLFIASEDGTLPTTVAETRVCRGTQEIFVCGHVTPEMGRNHEEKDKKTEKIGGAELYICCNSQRAACL